MIISLESSIRLLRYKSFFTIIIFHDIISTLSRVSRISQGLKFVRPRKSIHHTWNEIETEYLDMYNNIYKSNMPRYANDRSNNDR